MSTPSPHQSTALVYEVSVSTSGARNSGVPQNVLVLSSYPMPQWEKTNEQKGIWRMKLNDNGLWIVMLMLMYKPSPSLQSPKSAIFTKPSVSSSRLSNLRSLSNKTEMMPNIECCEERREKMWRQSTDSPIHNLMVMKELQTQDYTSWVETVRQRDRITTYWPHQWMHKLTRRHTSCFLPLTITDTAWLTQHVALKRRRHVCASWDLLLQCTPWQNTHVLASGNMQTCWPRRGGGSCWLSQRSASHTSNWRQGGWGEQ